MPSYDPYANNNSFGNTNNASLFSTSKGLTPKNSNYNFSDVSDIFKNTQSQIDNLQNQIKIYEPKTYNNQSLNSSISDGALKNSPSAMNNLSLAAKSFKKQNQFYDNGSPVMETIDGTEQATSRNLGKAGLYGAAAIGNILSGKKDTDMKYGTNDYFDNKNKNEALANTAANLVGSIVPEFGAIKAIGEGAQNLIAKKDAYGVSDKSNLAIRIGGLLNPLDTKTNALNDILHGKFDKNTATNFFLSGQAAVNQNKINKEKREELKTLDQQLELGKQKEIDKSNADIEQQKKQITAKGNESARLQSLLNNAYKTTSFKKGNKIIFKFKRGGELDIEKENVILNGPSHEEYNSTGVKNDKGLPIIHKNIKVAEIESLELVLNKESANELEKLKKEYERTKDKNILNKIGQIMGKEINKNTYDYSKQFLK